jgi:hypothetical protein
MADSQSMERQILVPVLSLGFGRKWHGGSQKLRWCQPSYCEIGWAAAVWSYGGAAGPCWRTQLIWLARCICLSATLFFPFCGSGSGCPATNFCKVSDLLEPIEPCWESNRTCQSDPGRGVKHQSLEWERGCWGLGSNARPPVRELARWTTKPHRLPSLLLCGQIRLWPKNISSKW